MISVKKYLQQVRYRDPKKVTRRFFPLVMTLKSCNTKLLLALRLDSLANRNQSPFEGVLLFLLSRGKTSLVLEQSQSGFPRDTKVLS